ncbi:hypothetical protein C8F01DRAFT_1108475 [Mycena amicta]|nr:hypothetical protein C8F01DRAFT_1108475 [Mycena amicta]
MSTGKRVELTAEQIALSQERKAKRQKLQNEPPQPAPRDLILPRPWIHVNQQPDIDHLRKFLAQSDAEILCLQEVDTLEKLLPALQLQYTTHYTAGPGKKHGCLIAFKKKSYEKLAERLVHFDEEEIRTEGAEHTRRGSSFRTRNIASLVALKNISRTGRGIVVGTSHLFWHPRYTYERCRQAGIFLREVAKFQAENQLEDWPLLVGQTLSLEQRDQLQSSRVVHVSIDPAVPPTVTAPLKEDEEEAVDPDRVITNARRALPSDGLLSDDELVALSAYDEGLKQHRLSAPTIRTFGDRMTLPADQKGYNEPEYTR